jgi:hypothetical protein
MMTESINTGSRTRQQPEIGDVVAAWGYTLESVGNPSKPVEIHGIVTTPEDPAFADAPAPPDPGGGKVLVAFPNVGTVRWMSVSELTVLEEEMGR